MRTVVITGVSSGIGFAIAKELVAHDTKVFGSVRTQEDALRVASELGANFVPLIFDITDEAAVSNAAEFVRKQLQGEKLSGLINNAGIAVVGAMIEIPLNELRQQFEVNVIGHLLVTQTFLPLLGADPTLKGKPGKIINMGSISGKLCRPFLGSYSMSKHALEALSETLRLELMLYEIDVILIAPGVIETPIWHKNESEISNEKLQESAYYKPMEKFKNYIFNVALKRALPAERISTLVLQVLCDDHPKTRYTVVPNKFKDWLLPLILPTRFKNKKIAKALGLIQ